ALPVRPPASSWQPPFRGRPEVAEQRGFFRRLVGGGTAAPSPVPEEPVPPTDQAKLEAQTAKPGWLQRLKAGLSRTSNALSQSLTALTRRKLDAAALDDLEDTLLRADLGPETAAAVVATLRRTRYDREITDAEIKTV